MSETPIIKLPESIKLYHGDMRDICKRFPDNSIDTIFTDPPYGKEFLYLYRDLAEVAMRILKPGGSLVTYFGQYAIYEVMTMLQDAGLKYWWQVCVEHAGHNKLLYDPGIKPAGDHYPTAFPLVPPSIPFFAMFSCIIHYTK